MYAQAARALEGPDTIFSPPVKKYASPSDADGTGRTAAEIDWLLNFRASTPSVDGNGTLNLDDSKMPAARSDEYGAAAAMASLKGPPDDASTETQLAEPCTPTNLPPVTFPELEGDLTYLKDAAWLTVNDLSSVSHLQTEDAFPEMNPRGYMAKQMMARLVETDAVLGRMRRRITKAKRKLRKYDLTEAPKKRMRYPTDGSPPVDMTTEEEAESIRRNLANYEFLKGETIDLTQPEEIDLTKDDEDKENMSI